MKQQEKDDIMAKVDRTGNLLSQMGNTFRGRKALILVWELSENLEAGDWKALIS